MPETCYKECVQIVCKPVQEQHVTYCFHQVQKQICEQHVRECPVTCCKPVCETIMKSVCCQVCKNVMETARQELLHHGVQERHEDVRKGMRAADLQAGDDHEVRHQAPVQGTVLRDLYKPGRCITCWETRCECCFDPCTCQTNQCIRKCRVTRQLPPETCTPPGVEVEVLDRTGAVHDLRQGMRPHQGAL